MGSSPRTANGGWDVEVFVHPLAVSGLGLEEPMKRLTGGTVVDDRRKTNNQTRAKLGLRPKSFGGLSLVHHLSFLREIFWRQHVCRRHARKLSNKHLMPFGPTSGCWCLLVSWHRLSPTIGLLCLSLVSLSTTSGQSPTKGVMSLRNQRKDQAKTNCLKDSCGFLSSYWNLWGTSSLEPDD